jgi:hypothetical protein
LTVRFNNEGHVMVVLQASPAGAKGGLSEVVAEVIRHASQPPSRSHLTGHSVALVP